LKNTTTDNPVARQATAIPAGAVNRGNGASVFRLNKGREMQVEM